MDFFGKLNAKNTFGMFEQGKGNNIVNIICGGLLIILIIVLIVCLVRKNDNFSNQNSKNTENDNDSVCFLIVRDGCGFAKRAHEQFKTNGMRLGNKTIQVIDLSEVSSKLGNEINSKVGGATPALVCNNKVILGLKPHDQYLKDVSEDSSDDNDSNNNSSGKDILLVGSMGCGFCRKAKELMEQLGLDYEFVESNSPHGLRRMKDNNANGVPLILKLSTNKTINGFNEQEIKNLKN